MFSLSVPWFLAIASILLPQASLIRINVVHDENTTSLTGINYGVPEILSIVAFLRHHRDSHKRFPV